MKNNEDPRLLAHMQAVKAERRAQAILRNRHANKVAFAKIAGATR